MSTKNLNYSGWLKGTRNSHGDDPTEYQDDDKIMCKLCDMNEVEEKNETCEECLEEIEELTKTK
jgi:hypothetical protein